MNQKPQSLFKSDRIVRSGIGLFMALVMVSPTLLIPQLGRADVVPLPTGILPGGVPMPGIPGMPSGDPTIKLPALPPLKPGPSTTPGLPGGFPTSPIVSPPTATTPGSTTLPGHPVMPGIDHSAYPGMTCALVDNRPHKDLLLALQNLTRVVVITPECQNNSDLTKMSDELKKMISSAQGLTGVWNNPQAVAADPSKAVDFQNSIGSMVIGINRITETMQNNSFLNSNCGSQMLKGSGVLTAVSDLITSFAPFALIGASMTPTVAVTLPWILGITGVGSVAKIAKSISNSQTVDTSRAEQRQAILMNVCEYSKIAQRVRFLKFAQSGKIDQVTKEIQSLRTGNENQLKAHFSDRVFMIARVRDQKLATLNDFDTKVQADHDDLQDALQDLNSYTDSYRTCYAGIDLADQNDATSLTKRMTTNLQNLIAQEVKPTFSQTNLLKTEGLLRSSLNAFGAKVQSLTSAEVNECANVSKSYGKAVTDLLGGAKATVKKLNASLDQQLKKDSEFAAFSESEVKALDEVKNLEKVAGILAQLNMDNSIIDRAEFDTQLSDLQRALFGSAPGLMGSVSKYLGGGNSPAMAWLDFVDEQQRKSLGHFNTEMSSILKDAQCFGDVGGKNCLGFGAPIPGEGMSDPFPLMPIDIRSPKMLSAITSEIAASGSKNHTVICQRLENIWFFWSAALDQLAAESFFCDNIRQFFNASTEDGLKMRCNDNVDLGGRVLNHSEIRRTEARMVDLGYKNQAMAVSAKFKELGCQIPDATVMK